MTEATDQERCPKCGNIVTKTSSRVGEFEVTEVSCKKDGFLYGTARGKLSSEEMAALQTAIHDELGPSDEEMN